MKKNALIPLFALVVVLVLAAVTLLSGLAFKPESNFILQYDFSKIAIGLAAAVILSFVFGFAKYDRSSGVVLGLVSLFDILMIASLIVLLTIPFKSMLTISAFPLAHLSLMLIPVFTYFQSISVLTVARRVYLESSRKDLSAEEAGKLGAKNTFFVRTILLLATVLLLCIVAVAGAGFASVMAPLAGSLVAFCSASTLVPVLFANTAGGIRGHKTRK